MKTIRADIKTGNFKHIYLLTGEETYLCLMYRERLRAAMTVPGDEMNTFSSFGKDINIKEIIDLSETLPAFAERRVFFIDDSGLFKKCPEEFSSYMSHIPETSYFVFTETKKDKTGKNEVDKRGKLYKQTAKYGHAAEFKRLTQSEQQSFVQSLVKKEGRLIYADAASCLLDMTGDDMGMIENETLKLLSYTLGRDAITKNDVEAVCSRQIENRIYEMVDAIGNKDRAKALLLYYDLLGLKEPAGRILYNLERQFDILMRIKDLTGRGISQREIAAMVGIPPFAAGRYMAQASKFSAGQLHEAFQDAVKTDEEIKTGIIDESAAIELFIAKYSAGA